VRLTVLFSLAVAVAGCAGQPRMAAPAAAASAPAAVVNAPAAGANPPATAVNAPAAGASPPPTAVNRNLVIQGYRPTTYHGQQLYCRMEKLTGSQFSHKVCLTEEEARLQERRAQDEMNRRGSQGKCMPPLCGG
jgi:hypothetical protein